MERVLNVLTVFSLALFMFVLMSVRRAHIRVEYSVSWITASLVLIVLSRSRVVLEWLGRFLGVSDPSVALIMIVFCVFLVVFYRFSVIISELKDANIAMAQKVAILEYRLQSLDEK